MGWFLIQGGRRNLPRPPSPHSRLARFIARDAFTAPVLTVPSLGTFYACAPAYKARQSVFVGGFYAVRLGQESSPGGDAEVTG